MISLLISILKVPFLASRYGYNGIRSNDASSIISSRLHLNRVNGNKRQAICYSYYPCQVPTVKDLTFFQGLLPIPVGVGVCQRWNLGNHLQNGDFALLACEITDLSGPTWFLLGVPSLRNDALRLQEVASWKASPFSFGNSSATFLQRFRVILGEECTTQQVAHFLMFRLTAHSPQLGISGFTGMRNRGAFDACQ